jgi:tRNA(Ile)-lysidine synthase
VREKILQRIRELALMRAGDRVGVAVSGGADSVALLRVLLELRGELGIVLSVAHYNHGLRGEASAADEAFVGELAKELGIELHVGHGDVRVHALNAKLSIEAAGRELRYRWLTSLAREQRLAAIATAHTLDDQAETVLLKFLRGAGTRGLAAIYPIITGSDARARIIRPLLCISRDEVESYLSSVGQTWREDESNLDRRFLRNRVRHELLPLLEREFNPNIRQVLSDVADLSRGEEEYWGERVERELATRTGATANGQSQDDSSPTSADTQTTNNLMLDGFAELPTAFQRRLLKTFAERQGLTLDFEHVETLRICALGERSKAELPGGRIATNKGMALNLCVPERQSSDAYRYTLPVPGQVYIPELQLTLRAHLVTAELAHDGPPGEFLSLDLVGPELVVRNWSHGDRFWPAHSRSGEKLKRLFAEKRVPAAERPSWPVVLSDTQIVWVRGFPAAQTHRWTGTGAAVRIEAVPTRIDR